MKTLLKNATLLEWCPCRVEPNVDIVIEGEMVLQVECGAKPHGLLAEVDEVIDCSSLIVMPALVVGHTHLYSSLATGMPGPRTRPTNFVEILENIWWVLDRALDDESTYYSALVGAIRAALSGAGTIIDHHASPNAIQGSLSLVRKGLEDVGLRGVLCYEVTDRNGAEGARLGVEENCKFLESGRKPGWYGGLFGAHASFTLSDTTLEQIAEAAQAFGVGVHIHCAEAESDNEDSLRRCGKRVVGRLLGHGILRPGTVLAHCTHLETSEIRLVYDQGCWIAHNPRSNMNNSVGYARVSDLAAGRLVLGTDGIDADMFTESKFAFLKARDARAELPFDAPLRWLGGAAQLATANLGVVLGYVRPGCQADLLLVDYPCATPLTTDNVAGHWFFGFNSSHVHSLMVGGNWVVKKKRLANENLYDELEKAQHVAERLWRRMAELT